MICFFRLRRGTFDLARGIECSLRLQQALEGLRFAARLDDRLPAKAPLPLRVLLREDVRVICAAALHLAAGGDLEALFRARVTLHLRHRRLLYFGARIIVIDFPSSLPALSIFETSESSDATRSRTAWPSSGCAICRPRNIIVTLTLFFSSRKRRACRVFVSKSWSSIPGRYLTSLSSITCCRFFASRAC